MASSAPATPREEAAPTERSTAGEGFAERLQQRRPLERSDRNDGTSAAKAPESSDTPPSEPPTVDSAAVSADALAPLPDAAPQPTATLTEALLGLIETTSTALAPVAPTDGAPQDPLLAALATLLAGVPQAQPVTVPLNTDLVALVPDDGADLLTTLPSVPAAPSNATMGNPAIASALATMTDDAGLPLVPGLAALVDSTVRSPGSNPQGATPADSLTAIATGTAPLAAAAQTADDASDAAGERGPSTAALPLATPSATTEAEAPFALPEAPSTPAIGAKATAPVSARPAPAEAGNPLERAVANQVSRALIQTSADGSRTISLRLTPPELGTVRIDIVERAGVMTARLHAEDAGVRVALERYLPQLRQELLAHNAPVRELQLADAWAGDLARQQSGDQHGRSSNRRSSRGSFALDGIPSAATAVASAPAPARSTITADRVDTRA